MFDVTVVGILAIAGGFLLGHLIFRRRGSGGAQRASATLSVLTSLVWLSAGVFAVLGGFYITGMIVIAAFFFIARGNYQKALGGEGLRARIAG